MKIDIRQQTISNHAFLHLIFGDCTDDGAESMPLNQIHELSSSSSKVNAARRHANARRAKRIRAFAIVLAACAASCVILYWMARFASFFGLSFQAGLGIFLMVVETIMSVFGTALMRLSHVRSQQVEEKFEKYFGYLA